MSLLISDKFAEAISNLSFLALSRTYHLVVRGIFLYFLVALIGKEQYGLYGYAQSWYLILAPLAVLGGNELLINGFQRTSKDERENYVGTALSVRLMLALPLSAALITIALLIESEPEPRLLIVIFAQALWLRVLISFYSSMFVARGRTSKWVPFSMAFTTIEALAILCVADLGLPLWTLAITQIAVLCATLAAAGVLTRRSYGAIPLRFKRQIAASFIRDGTLVGFATFLLLSIPPALIISYEAMGNNPGELGIIALISQLLLIAQQLTQRVSNAMLPALIPTSDKTRGNLLPFSALSVGLCVFIAGLLSLLAPPVASRLATLLSNQVFGDAVLLLSKHAWILAPMLAAQILRLVLIANDDAKGLFWSTMGGTLGLLLCVGRLASSGFLNPSNCLISAGLSFTLVAALQLTRIAISNGVADRT